MDSKVNIKEYYISSAVMAGVTSPIVVQIGLFITAFIPGLAMATEIYIIVIGLLLVGAWIVFLKKTSLPDHAFQAFLPVFLCFCYYMLLWSLVSVLYNIPLLFPLFTLPYLLLDILLAMSGDFRPFPAIISGITLVAGVTMLCYCKIKKRKLMIDIKFIACILVVACAMGFVLFRHLETRTRILAYDYQAEYISDEISYYRYRPFAADNLLVTLDEAATLSIQDDYPKLDGATAAYPVYSAMVQEIYKGLDEKTVKQYVDCTTTGQAYERLINGDIDIFFGAQPSKQQVQAAKEKGISFTLTPVAKEAFVFFVHKSNTVDSLTLEQIQDIYQKKITNWKGVGGNNKSIMPFQRAEGSGSQTIMLAKVMDGKALPTPLYEEYSDGMGNMIVSVADYRNDASSIGYSFRYFATGMKPNDNIKLLAIYGVAPTIENIQSETYPFTIDVYAVTANSTNPNTEKLIQWLLSEQGQNLIEKCGYVKR